MSRWNPKRPPEDGDEDKTERVGKMRRKGNRKPTSEALDLAEEYEKSEDEWALAGTEGAAQGAFIGRVVEVHKRYCFVSSEPELGKVKTNDVWLATIARKFLQAARSERNFVAVGDRVLCEPAPEQATGNPTDLPQCVIQHLSPRRSRIARLDPHRPGLEHVLASNMDQVMIVASFLSPPVKWGLIDRYLVLAESEQIPAVIVLNKRDLLDADPDRAFVDDAYEKVALYRSLGYEVFTLQANHPEAESDPQIVRIGEILGSKITLLSGHSGVGKSSVINLFDPEIVQLVEPDEDIFYKGRHTTTFASFIKLGKGATAGFAIDTPGIRSFTFREKTAIELSHCFAEMRPLLGHCKFRECRHMEEPECRVRAGVEDGTISRWRYKSYLAILLGASGREGRIRDLPLDD